MVFPRKITYCFEYKTKIYPDHWVTVFLHLIFLFCGYIYSKLHSFERQQTVWAGKLICKNKHNLDINFPFSFAVHRIWEMLRIFIEVKECKLALHHIQLSPKVLSLKWKTFLSSNFVGKQITSFNTVAKKCWSVAKWWNTI